MRRDRINRALHRNDLCDCPKSGAWTNRENAKKGMVKLRRKMQAAGKTILPDRVYECRQGVWHCTSTKERRPIK